MNINYMDTGIKLNGELSTYNLGDTSLSVIMSGVCLTGQYLKNNFW